MVPVVVVLVEVVLGLIVGFTMVVLRGMVVPVPMLMVPPVMVIEAVEVVALALFSRSVARFKAVHCVSYAEALAYALTDAGMAP